MTDNAAIVRRLFQAVEERDIAPMLEIYDPGVVIHEASSLPYGGRYVGHEGMARHGLAYLQAWDALQTETDRDLEAEFFEHGDRVLVRWRQKGHARDGRALAMPMVSEYRLSGGKVVESRMHPFDSAALADFLWRQEETRHD